MSGSGRRPETEDPAERAERTNTVATTGSAEISPTDSRALAQRRSEATSSELPALTIEDIKFAQSNFDRLDGDNNGFVSLEEIKGFEKANKNLDEADKATLKKLTGHMNKLEGYSDDEASWWENDGFTRKDLMVARSDVKTDATADGSNAQPRTFDNSGEDIRLALDHVNKNFGKMDADKDGSVSAKEINDYSTGNELSSSEVRMMRNLSNHYDDVAQSNKDANGTDELKGITVKDLFAANENVNTLVFATENFSALDANGDGFVAKKEISGYERAKDDLTAGEVKALRALGEKADALMKLNGDGSYNGEGISGHDLVVGMTDLGAGNASGQFKLSEQSITVASAATDSSPAETNPPPAGEEEIPEGSERHPEAAPVEREEEIRYHTVKPGDSLWKICREDLRQRNGGREPSYRDIISSVDAMASANGIERDSIIRPDQRLRFPDSSAEAAPAETVRPAAPRATSRLAEPTRIAPGEPDPNVRDRAQHRPTPGDGRVPPEERLLPRADLIERPVKPTRPQPLKSTDIVRKHFANMDSDGNNRVSEKEIRTYINDFGPYLSSQDRVALNRVARYAGKIQELRNDERGDENTGISANDLKKVDEMQEAARIMAKSGMWENFNTDADKYLKKHEIEQALRRANITAEERRALNYMFDNYGKFQEGNNDEKGDENSGITWNDLRWFSSFV